MSKMYDCMNKCICANCKRIKTNCAECKYSIDRTKECVDKGIKKCDYFIDNRKLEGVDNEKI